MLNYCYTNVPVGRFIGTDAVVLAVAGTAEREWLSVRLCTVVVL